MSRYTDLDFHHIQPTGVLGNIVELQTAQHPSRFTSGEGLVERASRVRRQIVQHDPDARRLGKVNIAEFAHAYGEVLCRTTLGDLHLAQWTMHIEEDEKVDRPIALILAVVALKLARIGQDRRWHLTEERVR